MNQQLHAGNSERNDGKVWHTDSKGLYWCGDWNHRTPEQLMRECVSTIKDLRKNHQELSLVMLDEFAKE